MIIQGKASWAKLNKPGNGYKNQYQEWSIDVSVDEATYAKLKAEGLAAKVKNIDAKLKAKDQEPRGDFMTFKRKTIKKDGTAAKPIDVVGPDKKPWDGRNIGNGSTVNVMFAINEFEDGKSASIIGVQVVDLVEYAGGVFEEFEAVEGSETQAEPW